MSQSTPQESVIDEQLSRLADFEPSPFPVISLYLNAQANQQGKDQFERFVKKQLSTRAKIFAEKSDERESFDRDAERIRQYLEDKVEPSANGVALFACSGENDFFEALQLAAPIQRHEIHVGRQPNLFTLAWLNDQFPRYAAVIADTNKARIFLCHLGTMTEATGVKTDTISRTKVGGHAQARYQRRVEKFHRDHAKEVVQQLDQIVEREGAQHILLAGDEVVVPLIKEELPAHLSERLVDTLRMDVNAPEQQVLEETLAAVHDQDASQDEDAVQRLLGEFRSGGLAVVGVHDTLAALARGQVDELLISSSVEQIVEDEPPDEETLALLDGALPPEKKSGVDEATRRKKVAGVLVKKAEETGAEVTFIEEQELVTTFGGVGGLLRYQI